ncbi:MAG: EpsI family protein [Pseudomonadales bacterium]|jgi:EpsI family protein|nr:EpsI family protein [Pseudomonadales bacterium]
MIRNLLIAQAVIGIGLSGIYLLPKTFNIRQSAIVMSLPSSLKDWRFKPSEPSKQVLDALADDTNYEQGIYYRTTPGRIGKLDLVRAFIVLSGEDMNNSIHRPERCLYAQGFEILDSRIININVGGSSTIPAQRLTSEHRSSGLQQVSYYWFTGAKVITSSHYSRTLTDMWDRLMTGTNQRWAYVTVSAFLNGEAPLTPHDEKYTNAMLTQFIGQIFGKIHKVEQLGDKWSTAGP